MHLSATQILSRQARSVVSGSMRQSSVRLAAAPTRQQVRLASTSTSTAATTSSSSSSSSSASKRAVPIAFLAAAAAAVTGYAVTSRSPLMAEESAKRKNYYERMKVEERKQQEEAKATEEAPSSEEGEVASPATEDLAEQASQESAFDPETNTINWDCPCLGGMAHGPCGEEFKKAFSCFVFSEEEPKGIDCVDNFKGMQDCFRKYPEHYKEELEDEEDFERQSSGEQDGQAKSASAGGGGDNGDEEEDEGIREFRREMNKE